MKEIVTHVHQNKRTEESQIKYSGSVLGWGKATSKAMSSSLMTFCSSNQRYDNVYSHCKGKYTSVQFQVHILKLSQL